MKQAMYEHGPLSVCVSVDSSFQAYNGGIFNNCGSTSINHAVVLVGWDDSLGSNGVWIMRNSWGTNWGEDGYMYIEYGCARIGYAAIYTRYTRRLPPGWITPAASTPSNSTRCSMIRRSTTPDLRSGSGGLAQR